MPSSATITTFYSFTANTRARASEANYNFGLFRGHLLPISPTTATGSDNTYALGSREYRWTNAWVTNGLYFSDTTSGYNNYIKNESGDINIYRSALSSTATATVVASFGQTNVFDLQSASGYYDFKVAGSRKSYITNSGFDGQYLQSNSVSLSALWVRGVTTTSVTCPAGQIGKSNGFNFTYIANGTVQNISGSTISIYCTGRPMRIGFAESSAGASCTFAMDANNVLVADKPAHILTVSLTEAGTTIQSYKFDGSFLADVNEIYTFLAAQDYIYSPGTGTAVYALTTKGQDRKSVV